MYLKLYIQVQFKTEIMQNLFQIVQSFLQTIIIYTSSSILYYVHTSVIYFIFFIILSILHVRQRGKEKKTRKGHSRGPTN